MCLRKLETIPLNDEIIDGHPNKARHKGSCNKFFVIAAIYCCCSERYKAVYPMLLHERGDYPKSTFRVIADAKYIRKVS